MTSFNDNFNEYECCTCNNLTEEYFKINFNEDKIKISIKQDFNVEINENLKKKVYDNKIVYVKKKINNVELSLDKLIHIEVHNKNNELYYGITFDSNSFFIVNKKHKKYCYVEYVPNKAITFNFKKINNNRISVSSIYLSYKI